MSEKVNPQIDVDTGHDYDGIHEFDNPLPNWWLAIFVLTTLFGYGYWMHYHVAGTGQGQIAEYNAEQGEIARKAASGKPITDDLLVNLSKDAPTVAAGQALFTQHCVVCHLANGEGKIGPNLTDAYWLHGPKPTDNHKVITNGVVEKGMPAWGPVLGAERVRALTAFILTKRGLNLPGKEPQGELAR